MPLPLLPLTLTPPPFAFAAPVLGAASVGAQITITPPAFTAGTPALGAASAIVSGTATRDESQFIRIDFPLRDVVTIKAPLK